MTDQLEAGPPEITNEYERALLGAILNGSPEIDAVGRIVTEGSFYRPLHGQIWDAVVDLHRAGIDVGPLTVKDHLLAAGVRFDPMYLHSLIAESWTDPVWSARKVQEGKVRRDVADLGVRCRQLLSNPTTSPDVLLTEIRNLADGIGTSNDTVPTIEAALEQVIDTAQHGEPDATPTPWPEITDWIGGAYPGQLITVGGRPGHGKTLVLENWATFIARGGKRVLFCSLEMSQKELTQRTMAYTARVELKKIRRGQDWLNEEEWERISAAGPIIAATPITIVDNRHRQTLAAIRAQTQATAQLAKRNGEVFGGVFVDYCQLVPSDQKRARRQEEVGEITRGLKIMAGEFGVPVIMGAQLNRQVDGRSSTIPILSDLREAGDIENDSDLVLLLHQKFTQDGDRVIPTDELDMIGAKQRNGPTFTTTLRKAGHLAKVFPW